MAGPVDPLEHTKGESIAPGKMTAGAHIGGYELREVLGEGGMGVVWKAHDPNLDREIAIKVLKRHDAHPSLRKRLLREGRAMARLKHPNVLTVYEVGTEADRDFIAMELVDGSSLDEWLTRNPTRDDVIRALLAAGRGLAAAHAAGLVHRDFKPHNVLRSRGGRILVTDFGLARGLGDDSSSGASEPMTPPRVPAAAGLDETLDAVKSPTPPSSSGSVRTDSVLDSPLTQTGALIGTPAYMAPEQFRGAAPDPRTDQFAFCVTAWQALTGTRPHGGATLDELRRSAERGIGNVASTLAPALRAVLARGLDPDPEKRWPDLDALLDQLEHVERPRRPRWIIPAAVLGVVALVGITVMITRRSGESPTVAKAVCEPADQLFADAWSDKLRYELWTTAAAAEVSPERFAHATDPFAEFRKRWITSYAEACNATQDARTAARVGCLLDARDQVSALALALKSANARIYESFDPYGILPNLAVCNGPRPVASPQIPPDKRTRVIAVIAGAFMTMASPRLAEAIDRLEKEAVDIGWAPLLPRVLMVGGNAYLRRRELDNAREMFKRAIDLAGPVNDLRTLAIARFGVLETSMIELVNPSGVRKRGELHPELVALLTYAKKAVELAGNDPMLAGSIALLEGQAYAALARWSYAKREYKMAIGLVQEARRQWEQAGDLQRAAQAAMVEAELVLLRADPSALDDALFVVRGAEETLDRARLTRSEPLAEVRARILFSRGSYSDASAIYDKVTHSPPRTSATKRAGSVLDASGKPVAGATVVSWRGELRGDPHTIVTDVRDALEVVTTTSDGTFEIHAEPDTALIATYGQTRSAPRLAGTGEVSLRFQPTREIAGKVDSANLGGVHVFAKTALGASAWIVRVPVKADKTFLLAGVPRGPVTFGTEGPAGDGTRILTAGANPADVSWPIGRAIEVIVRGRIEEDAGTVWIFLRPGAAPLPATRAEIAAFAARSGDVASVPLSPIGIGATDNGLELYEPGDHHAVVPNNLGGPLLACVAPAAAPDSAVTCRKVSMTTGAMFDHSDGRVGTDTQPVVINPVP